jgi:hypothetical protein
MDDALQQLFDAHFDGTLTDEQAVALQARLQQDPIALKAFWAEAKWHADLQIWGQQSKGRQQAEILPMPRKSPVWPRLVWGLGLAAALVVAGVLTFRHLLPSAEAIPLGRITFQQKTIWTEGERPAANGTMLAGTYHLVQGLLRFETEAGAIVSLAAPAQFRFTAADRIEMLSGRLTARMMHKGSQLTVKVRDMEVRDLGTAFGIDANDIKQTLVTVFDGLVAVTSRSVPGAELMVAEGQSLIGHHGGDHALQQAAYATQAFEELWPLTVGINESSKLVEFLPPGPLLRPLREYRSNDRLFLFPEQQHVATVRPLSIDLSPEAPVWPDSPVSPYPLPQGRRVSSYLVFFQPDVAVTGFRRLSGEITFQRRVLGVVCSDRGLDESDHVLGITNADYKTPHQRRGLEEADKENYRGAHLPHDSITISPDGRTVQFDFYVSDEREQLRVLVDAN